MKLDREQIQFIDNYLDNSDVIYADIRMEMVDHIASEIEARVEAGDTRGFYYVFKDYMVENKAQLLNNNRQFLRKVDAKNIKHIAKTMCSAKGILLFVCILLASHFVIEQVFVAKQIISKNILFVGAMLSIIPLAIFYLIISKIYGFSRFSGVERMGFAYAILFQLINAIQTFIRSYNEADGLSWVFTLGFAVSVFLIIVLVMATYKTIKVYQLKYKRSF